MTFQRACLATVVLSAASSLLACSKASDDATTTPAASATVAVPSAVPSGTSPAAPASTSVPAAKTASWSGTYVSAPGSMYVYDGGEWRGVHFRGDDASVALGEGTLALTIDPKTSLLRGTGSGPLGAVVLTGAVTEAHVTFTVLRKDPTDRGLTGTGSGEVAGDALTGTIRLSQGDAHIIREAKFRLTTAPP